MSRVCVHTRIICTVLHVSRITVIQSVLNFTHSIVIEHRLSHDVSWLRAEYAVLLIVIVIFVMIGYLTHCLILLNSWECVA
jgi:hypothetical protein